MMVIATALQVLNKFNIHKHKIAKNTKLDFSAAEKSYTQLVAQ